jgi:hypothetical protein
MGAEEPMHQEELTAATLGGPHGGDFAPAVQLVMARSLEDADGRVDRRMRCAIRPLAIPATIRHLLLKEVVGKSVETIVVVFEMRQDGKNHSRDARLASTHPFCPDPVVDTTVALDPAVEKEPTALSCLSVLGGQTEVAE